MRTLYVIHASVRASLAERFIFNFRLPAKALARYPLVSWLAPQEVRGLWRRLILRSRFTRHHRCPADHADRLTCISCAPRYAVLDLSLEQETPAVFVSERRTNSALGAWLTSVGFSAPHPQVQAAISYQDDRTLLRVESLDDGLLFLSTDSVRAGSYVLHYSCLNA